MCGHYISEFWPNACYFKRQKESLVSFELEHVQILRLAFFLITSRLFGLILFKDKGRTLNVSLKILVDANPPVKSKLSRSGNLTSLFNQLSESDKNLDVLRVLFPNASIFSILLCIKKEVSHG